jgi:hypothetical protein
MGMINGEMTPSAQARAREGLEHLQAAARELIEAARAALDVAEELVDDPESAASLVGTLASAADVAKRVTGSGGWPRARPGADASPPESEPREPRVQRIAVS